MNDQETDLCKRCDVEFSVKIRKHHCRMCGLIVCDSCSKNRVQLKKSGKKSRVCNECFNQIAPRHMRSVSSKIDSLHSDITHNDNDTPNIHQQATSQEVEQIIENLRQTAIKQKEKTELNKNESLPSAVSSSSLINNTNVHERTNTSGTFVQYTNTNTDTSNHSISDHYGSEPLLNNHQAGCCSCIIL